MPDAATGSRKPGAPSEAKGTPVEPRLRRAYPKAFGRTVTLIERICDEAGDADLVQTLRANLRRQGLLKAVRRRDTPLIFEWLVDALSYQGVSNLAAFTYMESHGRVRWADVARSMADRPSCPKLASFGEFVGCGYRKSTHTCACPEHLPRCPLPAHDLRNGRLNQMAHSLFLFMREVAGGDIVGWIDDRLAAVDLSGTAARADMLRQLLIEPLDKVYGVSNKVLAMALSALLLAGDRRRKRWVEAGTVMIAVDTLVHNFLHRTGILARLEAEHLYGTKCYRPNGCAAIIEAIAAEIDARRFNPAFPANFPRFVQHAIWNFCAEEGLDECNGRQIDDQTRCDRSHCPVFRRCDRVPLNKTRKRPRA
jgi:hypothetical protein